MRAAPSISIHRGKLHNVGFWEATQEEDWDYDNVGFWEAAQEEDWDCVFPHDVNLLPKDDRSLYICDVFPAIDRFKYK